MIASEAPAVRDRSMQARLGATAPTASDDGLATVFWRPCFGDELWPCLGCETATSQFLIWDRVVGDAGASRDADPVAIRDVGVSDQ
jgi:hypothetical protein